MFLGCSSLTSINLSNFDTKSVTNLNGMFWGCSSLTSIDLSNFKTNKVSDMNEIFYFCKNLKFINIANFSTNTTVKLFNKNLGPNGVIIANPNIYDNMDKTSKESIIGWTQK